MNFESPCSKFWFLTNYKHGKKATVYMLCRNKERAEAAQKDIQQLTNNQNVNVLLADVSEPSQIQRVVSEFQAKEEKLDELKSSIHLLELQLDSFISELKKI